MPRFSGVPSPVSRTFLIVAALLAAALVVPLVASAQDGGDDRPTSIPPFPVVYLEGTALLDGEPVAKGEIVVRVGDWEREKRIPVVNGMFDCANDEGCLLVGPPGLRVCRGAGDVPSERRAAGRPDVPVPAAGDALLRREHRAAVRRGCRAA